MSNIAIIDKEWQWKARALAQEGKQNSESDKKFKDALCEYIWSFPKERRKVLIGTPSKSWED